MKRKKAGYGHVWANERTLTYWEGSLRSVLARPSFWAVAVVYAICGFQDFFVATHIVAFALDEGVRPLLAGNMLAFMGLAGLVGVLVAGGLNDRFGPRFPAAASFVIPPNT